MNAYDAVVRFIAQWLIAIPVALVLLSIAKRRTWLDILEAAEAGLLTIVFVKLAALAYVHARPFVVHGYTPLVPHAPDNAFPSDHLAACGLAIGYLWTRNRFFSAAVLVCAALIGAARVLAGLHWPIDIAAGALLGIAAAAVAHLILRLRVAGAR